MRTMGIQRFGMEHSLYLSPKLVASIRLHSPLSMDSCERWTTPHSIRKFSVTSLNRFCKPSMMHGILQTQQRKSRANSMSSKCRSWQTVVGLNLWTLQPMAVAQVVGKRCLIQRTNTICLMVRHSSSSSWNSLTQRMLMRLLQ